MKEHQTTQETKSINHFIGLDWSQKIMAISRVCALSGKMASNTEHPADVEELKVYLKSLKGRVALTFEESTSSQWLYTELRDCVEEIFVCDPRRNGLLNEGAKTDKIDASKMATLYRAGLLKEVYHSSDDFIYLRKIMSGYADLIQSAVRLKNQQHALFRAEGKEYDSDSKGTTLKDHSHIFVNQTLEIQLSKNEESKKLYFEEFKKLRQKHKIISFLEGIPGIGIVGALTILSRVVCAERFPNKGCFLSYCGLVKHDLQSGGRSYGKRMTQYSRDLKKVFKLAAFSVLTNMDRSRNSEVQCFCEYYRYLINEKKYPEFKARHALARRIAVIAFGILKSQTKFKINSKWRTQQPHSSLHPMS